MPANPTEPRRCAEGTSKPSEEVTVTFDPEDAISIHGALRNVICADNLAAVGHALIEYAKQSS